MSRAGVWRTEGFDHYVLDNGAWSDFQASRPFDDVAFERLIERLGARAQWIVLPDIVAGGLASLELSLRWSNRCLSACPMVLLAVQDGMTEADVSPFVGPAIGLFLGGSTPWKISTMAAWGAFCCSRGVYYHVASGQHRRGAWRWRWRRELTASTAPVHPVTRPRQGCAGSRLPSDRSVDAGDGGMTYTVKEIFHTIQGEGANLGRPAIFIRFAGCNLWSGREEDRATAACRFCDTDFVGGRKFRTARDLANEAVSLWVGRNPFVVLTGGEPLLQVDDFLLGSLILRGAEIAVETNGTQTIPPGIDWVCVSPKAGAPLVVTTANELKLVYPQPGLDPESLLEFPCDHRWLSPMAGPDLARNTAEAAAYCLAHPQWRLAIQAHKFWRMP